MSTTNTEWEKIGNDIDIYTENSISMTNDGSKNCCWIRN